MLILLPLPGLNADYSAAVRRHCSKERGLVLFMDHKKKASKNYCHICGSVKRAIGFLLKRDRRLSNMSLFGNCPICPRDGMRVMEKTIMPRVRAVCVCEAECMREIRVVEKRIRGTIYFLYLSSFLGEKKIEDDS